MDSEDLNLHIKCDETIVNLAEALREADDYLLQMEARIGKSANLDKLIDLRIRIRKLLHAKR